MKLKNLEIKFELKKMGVNQYELAKKMRISPAWLSMQLSSKDFTEEEIKDIYFYAKAVQREKYGNLEGVSVNE